MIVFVLLTQCGARSAPYTRRVLTWGTQCQISHRRISSHLRIITRIYLPIFLSKSRCRSPFHSFLKICVHRPVQANFAVSHDNTPGIHSLYGGYHVGYTLDPGNTSLVHQSPFGPTPSATFHAQGPSTSMGARPTEGWADLSTCDPSRTATASARASIHPLLDPYFNRITTADLTEVPFEFVMNDSKRTIEKERWYCQYGINRDANGMFKCPDAGCAAKKKRRDQLWEHWKAEHNDDRYRCSGWLVFLCNDCQLYALTPISVIKHGPITAKRGIHAMHKRLFAKFG